MKREDDNDKDKVVDENDDNNAQYQIMLDNIQNSKQMFHGLDTQSITYTQFNGTASAENLS